MRVKVYPADIGRCGHRLIWPAEALAAQGADVELVLPTDGADAQIQGTWGTFGDGRREILDVDAPDADVVVLQRPLQRVLAGAVPLLQAKGVKVVVDVDDDFTTISRRNVSWRAVHPRPTIVRRGDGTEHTIGGPDRNFHHVADACRQADLVTVTTPALARRYGGHGRVRIVPNHVPAAYLALEVPPHDGVFVGWSGSIDTHPDDLQVTRGAVGRALRGGDARFAVVGTGKGVRKALGLDSEPIATGWLPLDRYPEAVAQLDIGIAPLELTAFNEAKSYLKGLEFAALGVAFVASPTEQYATCQPVGWIAHKPKDWERYVRTLIASTEGRVELARRGREWAATQTVEGNCEQWWDTWSSVVNTVCAR